MKIIETTIKNAVRLEKYAGRVEVLIDGEWITSWRDIRGGDGNADNPNYRIYGDKYVHEVPPTTPTRVMLTDYAAMDVKLAEAIAGIEQSDDG